MNRDERCEAALVSRRARSPTDVALRRTRRPTQNFAFHAEQNDERTRFDRSTSLLAVFESAPLCAETAHPSVHLLAGPLLAAPAGLPDRAKRGSPATAPVLAPRSARRLADHTVKHARAQLRAADIRPPADHEALLATYLDRQPAPPIRRSARADAGSRSSADVAGRHRSGTPTHAASGLSADKARRTHSSFSRDA